MTPQQCRVHAANRETIWSGQPGWNPTNNMAVEWRKAADRIEQLMAALAPFAMLADDYDEREDDFLRIMVDADQIHLRVGHMRAARSAFNGVP